ncbi:hypothetical protein FHS26_006901 [Rhizobium pisi]|uniref:Uncharacterized protein n=1 Tax=Rhizobium pisi TaxID=574561 RepID=A0A3R9A7J3_9HYPH|nr:MULTISPECIES: hypothetical protein [Rhizobium]MBB3139116.1 hypothetical protein [Rhizobium pisi]RSB59023.1 hypothetical protein EFD55_32870 [Rhizobium pisi]TAV45337.1 hypothetical protein ELI31_26080 [Rhizobium leguminosarum]TAV45895.1 hypothetical protein ELI32_27390 [Rhizobium leguminosarum]TAV63750.1 hypothetical protein ELI30_27160 [Rhizobium leguminosarum]
MSFYAIEVLVYGTVYIKASTLQKAQKILDRLSSNTIDARHRAWFSDVSFEHVPRVSFASSLTLNATFPGSQLVEVTERDVELAQRSFVLGSRDVVVPFAERAEEFNKVPVFTTDVDLTATAFIKAESRQEARIITSKFQQQFHVELQMGYWLWFSKLGFDDDEMAALPVVLSSAIKVIGASEGCGLEQRWPD